MVRLLSVESKDILDDMEYPKALEIVTDTLEELLLKW